MAEPAPEPSAEEGKDGSPMPVWRNGAYAGEFGDAFIAETDLEGGHSGPAITQLLEVVRKVLAARAGESALLDDKATATALDVAAGLEEAASIEEDKAGAKAFDGFADFLTSFLSKLRALEPGQRLPFCGGWMAKGGGHALMFVAERSVEEETFALVVCNTGQGVQYHPKVQGDYPKTKHRCAIRIKGIPASDFLDEGVWYLFHKIMCFPEKEHGPEMMYEVILPHLCETIAVARDEMSADEVAKWATREGFPKELGIAITKHSLDSARLQVMPKSELSWRVRACSYSLKHWSAAEVGLWLKCDLELPEVAESFENVFEVNGENVATLDADGLEAFGVDPAEHEKILTAIKKEDARKVGMADRAKPSFDLLLNQDLKSCAGHAEFKAELSQQLTGRAEARLVGKKVIGLYFSASWCGPCKAFTPKLKACYEALCQRADTSFEVVFVSSDKTQAEYDGYTKDMPWLALPFENEDAKSLLSDMLGIRGIPTLVLVDEEGGLISMDGVRLISEDAAGANYPWGLDASVDSFLIKLAALKGQTYSCSSLAAAVERCDKDDSNGDFETIQRAGTCYFRCILTCFKYMLKSAGMDKPTRKQLFYLFRLGFLDAVETDLSIPHKCKGFQDSDRRMIELGCTQTALAAVKEHKAGNLPLERLRAVQEQVVRIKAAAQTAEAAAANSQTAQEERGSMWLDMAGSSTATLVPYHGFELVATVGGTLVECTLDAAQLGQLQFTGATADTMRLSALPTGVKGLRKGLKLRGVSSQSLQPDMPCADVMTLLAGSADTMTLHFEDHYSTDSEAWTGGLTEANPPLFVDLCEPSADLSSFSAAAAHVAKCRVSCEEIRKKTCATSVVLNQICALVENTFTEVVPLPLPQQQQGNGPTCVWAPGSEAAPTSAQQLVCLEDLKTIALIYSASSFSNVYDRSTDAVRAVTMGSLLAIFDACLRIQASDGARAISQLVAGASGGGAYWFATTSFDKHSFSKLSERMLLYTPGALAARRSLIQYFEHSEASGARKLFDWEIEKARSGGMGAMFGGGDGGDEPNYKVMEDDTSLVFVRSALEQLGVQTLPNRSGARYGGAAHETRWEVVSDVEKSARWFADENWEVAPEFNWYRDIHFLFQLSLDDTELLYRANRNWPKLWSTSHGGILPLFQFKGTDRDQKMAALRVSVGDWRTATKFSVDTGRRKTPAELEVYVNIDKKPVPRGGGPPGMPSMDQFAQMLGRMGLPPEAVEQALEEIEQAGGVEALAEQMGGAGGMMGMMMGMMGGGMGGGGGGGGGGSRTTLASEEDVLFLDNLPSWSDAVSEEEAERVLTYLTAPYIAPPLLLSFFADGRVGVLVNSSLQSLLESVLFEPLAFAGNDAQAAAVTAVVPVPEGQRSAALGTGYGILMNEVVYTPDAVLTPLLKICRDIADLCIGDFKSKFADLLHFIVRMATRVQSFFTFAQKSSKFDYRPSSDTPRLLAQLYGFLWQTAAPLITNWLRQAQAADEIGFATSSCTHLALIYATLEEHATFTRETAEAFLSAVAFVVSWHSKEPGEQSAKKGKTSARERARQRQAMQNRSAFDDLPKLLTVPVHDVFKAMEHQRAAVLQWSENVNDPIDRDVVLSKIVGAALQGEAPHEIADGDGDEQPNFREAESAAVRGWREVSEAPLGCEVVIESEHPYLPSTDATWTVRFPGAEYVTLNFDPQSKTEESEGEAHDYVTIYKDSSCTDHWGPHKRIGGMQPDGWPGANGPGFTVPGDSVVVHFHSDTTNEEWGFKLTLVAPVCMPSVAALLANNARIKALTSGTVSQEVKTLMCQHALVACRNDMGPSPEQRALPLPPSGEAVSADEHLSANWDELLATASEQIATAEAASKAEAASAGAVGLYTDPMGNIEVNMQTGEVYLRKRMLMPTPREITSHTDFRAVFKGDSPFCAVTSANENRYWVTIIHGEHSYEVMAWTPFQFDEARSSKPGEAAGGGSGAQLLLGGLPDQQCYSMPARTRITLGDDRIVDGLRFAGADFKPFTMGEESAGWVSDLLSPLITNAVEKLEMDEAPLLWISTANGGGIENALECELLMYAPASGSLEERKGHPGAFFDIHALKGRQVVHVFALLEEARRVQRQLVFTTNSKLALKHLQVSSAKRDNPWVDGTRNAAGNMFDTLLTDDGALISRPGVGSAATSSIGTLWIKRNRILTDGSDGDSTAAAPADDDDLRAGEDAAFLLEEWNHEVLLPRRVLSGLIPDALLEAYQFWKTGPLVLRGYATHPEDEHTIHVRLCTTGGDSLGVDSYTAVIRRMKKKRAQQKGEAGGDAGMLLLNLLRAPESSPLHKLASVLSRLDSLSHVLAWSQSDARQLGEEVDITLIELPRLKMRFEARNIEGETKLHSLDYDSMFVCDKPDAAVAHLAKDIPHSVVLESMVGQKSLLVPNYALERVTIRSCPLNTELVLKSSKFDELEEHWATDEWAKSVQTRFYIYPVHLSGTFLQTASLSSAFYLVLIFLMKREYEQAAKLMSSCFTDTAFSGEEKWIMKLIGKTAEDDKHPDAHACRLRLALVCYECAEEVPWKVEEDMQGYITKFGHVATVCRLSVEDETLLLQHHSDPTRSKYLTAVQEAASRSPGDNAVEVPFKGAPCEVGGAQLQQLHFHLGRKLTLDRLAKSGIPPMTQFKYERPDASQASGAKAVELLRDFEKDDFSGRKKGKGFCFLYEILIGRIHINITGSAQEQPIVEPDYSQDIELPGAGSGGRNCPQGHSLAHNPQPGNSCDVCAQRGTAFRCSSGCDWDMCANCWSQRDPANAASSALTKASSRIVEAEESLGAVRRMPANGVLVKLLVGSMLVKETDCFKSQQLRPEAAVGASLLLPAMHAATTGEPAMEKYPSFPVAANKAKLSDGMKVGDDTGGQQQQFFGLLIQRNVSWVDGQQYREVLTALPSPANYPSTLSIPAAFRMNCRPPLTGCDCGTRDLKSLSVADLDGSAAKELDLTDEDVAAFSQMPLTKLVDVNSHLVSAPRVVNPKGMLNTLPFDLSSLPVAQSEVAISMLSRINDDLERSFEAAQHGEVLRLKYLDDNHIAALRKDISGEEDDDDEDETDAPTSPRNQFIKTFSVNTTGLARTVSARGSSMLKIALQHLEQLRSSLLSARDDESVRIAASVKAVEAMGNDTAHVVDMSEAERLAFELERFAGQRILLWFELIAAAPLSSSSVTDLLRLNKCLAPKQIEYLVAAVCGVLMRSVRLSQLNMCIASIDKLMGDIKLLVEQRVYADWLNDSVDKQPSIDMIQFALKESTYDESRGNVALKVMLTTQERILDWAAGKFPALNGDEGLEAAVDVCFQFCAFDEERTLAMMTDEKTVRHIVDLALRGCHYQGRALMKPSIEAKLSRATTAMKASAGQSLGGMVHLLQHSSHAVASNLSACRGYMQLDATEGSDGCSSTYDPRFLIFEYMVGFMLRRRQVELINGFVENAKEGVSRVEQMIMGQGKTTVIGPMLALMLGDNGKRLVTQVCPEALLDMTRDVMRACFSSVVTKRVYTLVFDRGSPASNDLEQFERLRKKLEVARQEGSIVVTTPGAVKSLMLKYVDLLQGVEAAPAILRCPAARLGNQRDKALAMGAELSENAAKADVLSKIIQLWGKEQNGVALLDEVDLLLHPLKSELNYPIGPKEQLESSEFRWDLPIFLLDALLYPSTKKISLEDFRPSSQAVRILRDIAKTMDEGVQAMAVQPSPHLSLVRTDFYEQRLKHSMAEWAMLWLLEQPEIRQAAEYIRERSHTTRRGEVVLNLGSTETESLFLGYISSDPERYAKAYEILGWLQATTLDINIAESNAAGAEEATLTEHGDTTGAVDNESHQKAMKMLNLARDWVCNFLAHCFAKVDRVGYGLLHPEDLQRWEEQEGRPVANPAPRALLAVPFVALEVPSRSSEFAHPEVLIGLTVLAYRYEGLRVSDLKKVVKSLKKDMDAQAGPFSERAARIQFNSWVDDAKLQHLSQATESGSAAPPLPEVMDLELFQADDDEQMAGLMKILSKHGPCIIYHLQKMVFPKVMKKQVVKLQASGVDLGGDMIFGTRLGFSGTPSDLLPDSLKPCHYEPGSEAEIIRVLTSPDFVSSEEYVPDLLNPREAVTSFLRHIATAKQPNGKGYSALIDTGAMITGFSNEIVARTLLEIGLSHCDACVFLDGSDRKMVVDRSDGNPVPLNRCGIKKERRFVFYDQVHTTGMDIKHALDACAIVTLGKDMTLRDFAQGCYRMRGLAKGQTLHLLVSQEVLELVHRVSATADMATDVMAWLISQSMKSEKLQYMMLAKQRVNDCFRTSAFADLLQSTAPKQGSFLAVGGRQVKYSVASFCPHNKGFEGMVVPAIPELGNTDLTNADEIAGKVAIFRRGGAQFVEKAQRAQAAGAIGAIIINSKDKERLFTMSGDGRVNIPVVLINKKDGDELLAKKGCSATLFIEDTSEAYPLKTRFYKAVPEAEVEAVLGSSSLYTAEELEAQEKEQEEAKAKEEFNRMVQHLRTVMDRELVQAVLQGLQQEQPPFTVALQRLSEFAEANGVNPTPPSAEEAAAAALRDGALKKDLAHALEQLGLVLGSDVVGEIQSSREFRVKPLSEQLAHLQGFGIPFTLPSESAAAMSEPAGGLPDPEPEPEPEVGPEDQPFNVTIELVSEEGGEQGAGGKSLQVQVRPSDSIAAVHEKVRRAADLGEGAQCSLINTADGRVLLERVVSDGGGDGTSGGADADAEAELAAAIALSLGGDAGGEGETGGGRTGPGAPADVAMTVRDFGLGAGARLKLLVHGESVPFSLGRAKSVDDESMALAFTTSLASPRAADATDEGAALWWTASTVVRSDGPWLRKCIGLFKEPLEVSLLGDVPTVTPYSEVLTTGLPPEFVATNPSAAATAYQIIADLREGEAKLAAIEGDGDGAAVPESTNLDSEVVQEQEQEQENEEEAEEKKQNQTAYARNPADETTWPLQLLGERPLQTTTSRPGAGGSVGLIGPSFYRASSFRVTPVSASLAFPEQLLVSNNFAPQLHRADEARRLKNVEVLMRWEATCDEEGGGGGDVLCVVLSLAEAETVRRHVQHNGGHGGRVSLCSSGGLWLSAKPPIETRLLQSPKGEGMTALRDAVATEQYRRERAVGSDKAAGQAAAAEAGERVVRAQLSTLIAQECKRLVSAGTPATEAAEQAVAFASAHLEGKGGELSSSFEILRQCARFWNNDMWFEEQEVILILGALSGSAESDRRAAFEEVVGCRKRDRVEWAGTAVERVFSHADEQQLLRLRGLSMRVRGALARATAGDGESPTSGKRSLMAIFEAWDTDKDGWLSQSELESALCEPLLGLNLKPEEVAELLRHADQNNDGLLSFREFSAEFGPRSSEQLSRAERMLRNRKQQQLSSSDDAAGGGGGGGIKGLQDVVSGLQRTETLSAALSASLNEMGQPTTGQFDWRRLASLGTYFVCAGGHAQFHGDGRVTTLPGYCPSISPRGVALTHGKWYYEVVVVSRGRGSIGWADYEYSGDAGCGVGDDRHSWGFDGYSGVIRHGGTDNAEWGAAGGANVEWSAGDVIGCFADLDNNEVFYSQNGQMMGTGAAAFSGSGFLYANCLSPMISFESSLQFRVNFGDKPLRYPPPAGYRSVQHWVREFVEMKHVQANRTRFGKVQATSGSQNVKLEIEPSGTILMEAERTGGGHNFPSATVSGLLLTTGKWYYEFTVVENSMAIQIGWADLDFVGSQRDGHGVGDDKHSWGYDGCRAPAQGLWWDGYHTFGRSWTGGDTIGCEMDLDERRMSFSLNGSFARPMGTCPTLENLAFVVGLTPGFTMQAPTTIRINLGAKPFKYKPRNGVAPVQAWVNERRHRYLDKDFDSEARMTAIGESLSEVAVKEAMGGEVENPLVLEHERRLLEAEQRELSLRITPATAATWSTESGGLDRTVTFEMAATSLLADEGGGAAVPLRVSSGYSKAVISPSDGCIHCLGNYPSVVAEVGPQPLRSGKWVFEVEVLELDPTSNVPSAVIGWADSRRFFGDYAAELGVGDDEFSVGLTVQRSRPMQVKKSRCARDFGQFPSMALARTHTFDEGIAQGTTVGCALYLDLEGPDPKIRVYFGRDGVWTEVQTPPPLFSAIPDEGGGGFLPALSLRKDCRLQLNLGARPFQQAVPEGGFLPVHCAGMSATAAAPGWLQTTPLVLPPTSSSASPAAATPSGGGGGGAAAGLTPQLSAAVEAAASSVLDAPAGSSPQSKQALILLMQQLRITSQLLRIEAEKLSDPNLNKLVADLEGDMKRVAARIGGHVMPNPQPDEGVPP